MERYSRENIIRTLSNFDLGDDEIDKIIKELDRLERNGITAEEQKVIDRIEGRKERLRVPGKYKKHPLSDVYDEYLRMLSNKTSAEYTDNLPF